VVDDDLEGGQKALLLALEVGVEDPPADLRVADDVAQRHRTVALLRHRLGEPRNQPLALMVGDLLAAVAVAAGGEGP
jgi:hypothetical protein